MLSEAGNSVFLLFLSVHVRPSFCNFACAETEKLLTRNGCYLAWMYTRYD